MASNVTRNEHVITREIFDLPCALNLRRRLEGDFFFHNAFIPFRCKNQAQLSSLVENFFFPFFKETNILFGSE